MSKRSSFVRRRADAYDTPASAVPALLPHLRPDTRFVEPCAGRGDLVRWLEEAGHHCFYASDVEPRAGAWDGEIFQRDVLKDDILSVDAGMADCFITNPPWSRDVLHRIILRLSAIMPTWLLFDADWISTLQARPYLILLHRVVSVGRVKWIEGSPSISKDNAAWHYFAQPRKPGHAIEFFGRGP
jgi:hypothetical protein